MSSIYLKEQTLPTDVHRAFGRFGKDLEARNDYASQLRAAHWTLSAIAMAAGISRERVRQILTTPTTTYRGPVPTPPVRPPKPVKASPIEPDPAKLARLLELQPLARKVTGNSPNYREAGEAYTKLIAEVHLQDHVPLYRLAKHLGLTSGALRSRLVRYLYLQPKTGRSKSYNRINPQNRVGV